MATQQQRKTVEIVANDTKMAWNCNSNKEKHKYNGKILTGTKGMKASNDGVKVIP